MVNFRQIFIKGKEIWFELAGNSSYRGSTVINNVVFFFSVTNEETHIYIYIYEQLLQCCSFSLVASPIV